MKDNVIQNAIETHDEKMVNDALSRGDIEQAKHVEQVLRWKPKKISNSHLRSRAKVYLAMGELDSASKDAEELYLATKQKSGYMSMRTDEFTEAEALRETIRKKAKRIRNPRPISIRRTAKSTPEARS